MDKIFDSKTYELNIYNMPNDDDYNSNKQINKNVLNFSIDQELIGNEDNINQSKDNIQPSSNNHTNLHNILFNSLNIVARNNVKIPPLNPIIKNLQTCTDSYQDNNKDNLT